MLSRHKIFWRRPWRALLSWAERLRQDERGQVALIFALGGPAVILLAVGAVDLNNVQSARVRLQSIADAAALAGANELGLAIADTSAIERAEAYVAGNLDEWNSKPEVTPKFRVFQRQNHRIIEVVLDGHSPSFFGDMLPRGGWKYRAEARAAAVGLTPLCVLVSGNSGSKLLNIKDQGRIQAPQCLVHSNRDIRVEGGSITAFQVQAVTAAQGAISPTPGTGAAPIVDTFAGLDLRDNQPCPLRDRANLDVSTGTYRIAPGVHCGDFKMDGNSELILEAGEHWFLGSHLEVKGNARLAGGDVVLFFDKDSWFNFREHATVVLEGRKTGLYAGMVLIGMRNNTQKLKISSDNVQTLLGVIYVPNAQLIVEGTADVARDSAWTVVIAQSVQLRGSPSLLINADYTSSDVPVPTGVGPRDGGSQLIF